MVGGDPALEPVEPLPVAEHPQIGIRQIGRALTGMLADPGALIGGGEAQAGRQALRDGRVAARRG